MARKNPAELGERLPDTFRYGPTTPVLGHVRRGDPGGIVLPQMAFLRNVRLQKTLITGRPPAARRINGISSVSAAVKSLFDFQPTGLGAMNKLYIVYDGCPGVHPTNGSSANWFDHEQSSRFSRGIYYDTASSNVVIAAHDGNIFLARDDKLSLFSTITPDYEDESLAIAGVDQSELLKTFTGFTIRCMVSAFGELFIGLDAGAGASKVVRYDGKTFRDDDTGVDPPSVMRMLHSDKLVVGRSTSGIRVRTASGTWSAVAGAVSAVDMVEYRNVLYISEDGADLWSYDGTTLGIARTIAGAQIYGLAQAFGYMYYGYLSSTPAGIIGRLDSAGAYTDVHKNLTTQDGIVRKPKALAFYRGALMAGVNTAATGGKLFLSPGTDTAGTYLPFVSNAANNGDLISFAVI